MNLLDESKKLERRIRILNSKLMDIRQIAYTPLNLTHNVLLGLQGGAAGEYYHNTLAVNNALTDIHAQLTALHTDGTPTFAGIVIAGDGTIGQAAGPLIRFDDINDFLEITGCKVHIGGTYPFSKLMVSDINAGTNNALQILEVNRRTSGSPAAGLEGRIGLDLQDADGNDITTAAIGTIWVDPAIAVRSANTVIYSGLHNSLVKCITCLSTGNVDIGLGLLRAQGFVSPTSGSGLELGYDGARGIIEARNRDAAIGKPLWLNYAINTDVIICGDSAGLLGVGKTNPAYKIDSSGDINTDGIFRVGGSQIELNDLFDVDIDSPLDGDVLMYNDLTGKWENVYCNCVGGSGGGAPTDATYITGTADATLSAERVKRALYLNYDIDDEPAAPNALDDEFDNGALDGKWTITNDPGAPNAISETAFTGFIWVGLLELGTDDFDNLVRIFQVPPAGAAAMTYIIKCSVGVQALESSTDAGEFCGVGIYLGNSAEDELVASIMQYNDASGDWLACRLQGQNDMAVPTFNNYQIVPAGGSYYLKLEKITTAAYTSANTYNMYYSFNGMVWYHCGQQVKTFTHACDELGIIFRRPKAQGGSPIGYGIVDFFRRIV